MRIEQQVCSLELSKRLKELGVKQDSLFYWYDWKNLKGDNSKKTFIKYDTNPNWDWIAYSYFKEKAICSAYTVAELGEMLKIGGYDEGISVAYTDIHFRGFRSGKSTLEHQEYICNFSNWGKKTKLENGDDIPEEITFTEPKEADARAKMLIYLLENNLIIK